MFHASPSVSLSFSFSISGTRKLSSLLFLSISTTYVPSHKKRSKTYTSSLLHEATVTETLLNHRTLLCISTPKQVSDKVGVQSMNRLTLASSTKLCSRTRTNKFSFFQNSDRADDVVSRVIGGSMKLVVLHYVVVVLDGHHWSVRVSHQLVSST